MSNGSSKTKLDSLLRYLPDAIKEKTLKLMKKNGGHEYLTNSGIGIKVENVVDFTDNQQGDMGQESNDNVFDDKILPIEFKFGDETMNDANTNTNILQNNNGSESEDVLFPDDNICFLNNEINNFLDSYFESNEKSCNLLFLHKDDETESNLNVNTGNTGSSVSGTNLNSMVQQLSSLEELLLNTKRQILSGSAFSEPQKVLTK